MTKNKELKALGSKLILLDGNIILLEELTEEEKSMRVSSVCKNASQHMSKYYSNHPECFANLINAMSHQKES